MSEIILNAEVRTDSGKGASRRLRREDKVPAIVYGADKEPVSATLNGRELRKAEQVEEFYSQPVKLVVDGAEEVVIVKSLQRHPVKESIHHVDFQRIDANAQITTSVPLHFANEDVAPGIKAGGAVAKFTTTVSIRCLPAALPKYIEVNMAELNVGDTIHLSDLVLPEGVEATELVRGHNQGIVGILATRSSRSADDESAE